MNKKKTINDRTGLEVAVIGMAGRFPGARNINEFWDNLKSGVESISFFSEEELEECGIDRELLKNPNFVKASAILDYIEYFDAFFFDYTPSEAAIMNPQLRIFHECAWEALEDAGYNPEGYDGLIGLYAGASSSFYWEGLALLSGEINELGQLMAGNLTNKDYLTTTVSYKLDLRGPSSFVQTACSTSLVAIHWACRAILSGECHIALAGGITVSQFQKYGYMFKEGMIASPDGHCRAFDAKAKGTIGGSAVGIVVLKRLKNALRDGDNIYAVIKGSAINNDGKRKVGFTAPSVHGQVEVIRTALAMARVEPESIGYVETHGTGTTLGDPVEIKALTLAFHTDKKAFCPIGSIKTNVGHLNSAAGAAGFIKTVLALKHRLIPPNLHFETPNPGIDFENGPFYMNAALKEWGNSKYPLRAGVSSFGIGGTNAHVILEEPPVVGGSVIETECGIIQPCKRREHQLILLSAKTGTALERMTKNLAEHLKKYLINPENTANPGFNLADAAYTLQVGRKVFEYRGMIVCSTMNESIEILASPDSGKVHTYFSNNKKKPVIFMFPGLGSQYVNMGLDLYNTEPVFLEEMNRCFDILKPIMSYDLKDILYPNEKPTGTKNLCKGEVSLPSTAPGHLHLTPDINQVEIAQLVVFMIEYVLANLLIRWGIKPHAMIGYSFGEYAAACVSGVFSLEEALELIVSRGRLIQQVPSGSMMSVPLSRGKLIPFLNDQLSLAIDNGPSCIVAGSNGAIEAFEKKMKKKKLLCIRMPNSHAIHSHMMEPILGEFEKIVEGLPRNKPQIPYISNVTGGWISAERPIEPTYWTKHLRETVRFADGINQLRKQENAVFVEIGPGRDLSTLVARYLDNDSEHQVLNILKHPSKNISDVSFLLNRIGRLWLLGVKIDWNNFYFDQKRHRISLPTYPFERQRFWIEDDLYKTGKKMLVKNSLFRKKNHIADWFYTPSWKRMKIPVNKFRDGLVRLCCLVFSDELGIGDQLVKKLKENQQTVIIVRMGSTFQKKNDHEFTINPRYDHDNGCDVLFNELSRRNILPSKIIHLWNLTKNDNQELDIRCVETALDLGFHSLIHIAQAIGRQSFNNKTQITVVTNNIHEVIGGEGVNPEKATVLGPVRVIPVEYSNICCRSMDIILPEPGSSQEASLIDQLIEELYAESCDPIVAFRGHHRWVQTYEPIRLEKSEKKSAALRQKGVYLITGGLGGVGFALAEYLAKNARVKLILTGRSVFPARSHWEKWLSTNDKENIVSKKIRKVKQLEKLGAEVSVFSADVTDEKRMQEVITQTRKKFGRINGVIHAAGLPDGKMIQRRTRESSERILEIKIKGTVILDKILKNVKLDFFILCSDLSSILSAFGQVGCSAGNLFLDAFTDYKTSRGSTFIVSINWDRWQKVGIAVIAENMHKKLTGEDLKGGITVEEGKEAFGRILETKLSHVAVASRDLEVLIEQPNTSEAVPFVDGLGGKPISKGIYKHPELDTEYVPPRNETEQILVDIWSTFFGIEHVGIHDDFFELKGDSLKALILINRIHKRFNVEVPIVEFFNRPTIQGLTEYILHHGEIKSYTFIEATEEKEYYALSSAQKRLYLIQQMKTDNISYNLTFVMALESECDKNRMEKTFRKLLERHDSLKTSFEMVGYEPVQKIHDNVEFEIEYYDMQSIAHGEVCTGTKRQEIEDEEQNPGVTAEKMVQNFVRPFNLSYVPLLRVGLIKAAEENHIFMVDMHHIISDGVSLEIFVREFMMLYTGKELPPLRLQYKDYSEWKNLEKEKPVIKHQQEYWNDVFSGEIPVLSLPTDYSRPTLQDFEGGTVSFSLGREESGNLRKLARENEVTLFMLLISLYNIFLAKICSQQDIIIGTPVVGRRHADLEQIIGIFINTLALRNFPRENKGFKEFLLEVRARIIAAFENQDHQFEDLVEEIVVNRDVSRNPLFDAGFSLYATDTGSAASYEKVLGNLIPKPYEFDYTTSKFDLTLYAADLEEDFHFHFEYSRKLFKEETVERFITYFKNIVTGVLEDKHRKISGLEILTEEEKNRLSIEFNDTETDYPQEKTIHELFAEQAEKTPDHIAVVYWSNQITYRELNKRSNRLALILRAKGVKNDSIVSLMLDRSINMMIGILGILKAGGAYLPIDKDYPKNRIISMLEDSRASLLLTSTAIVKKHSFTALQNIKTTAVTPHLTALRQQIKGLDNLPIPDRSLVDYEKYRKGIGMAMARNTIAIQATRGCPFKCLYCHKIWPKSHIARSAEHIFAEVRLYYGMGVRRFVFIDDIFNLNKENSTRFFKLVIENGLDIQMFFPNGIRGDLLTREYIDLMVEAGTINIALALETASPRLQKLIGKNINLDKLHENMDYICKKYPQVISELFTMHGFPTETEEEALITLDFIKSMKWLHIPHINILKIYPNTDMAKFALENGISMEDIINSESLAYHELPNTLPFDKEFTLKYQTDITNEYFLSKERLLHVLPHQMKVLTGSEIVEKYNSFLPTTINSFADLLQLTGIRGEELGGEGCLDEEYIAVPGLYKKMKKQFPASKTFNNALRVMLLDLSQFFSGEADILYDVIEPPLGLMYVMTNLKKQLGSKINGKIAKSRIDFDNYTELKALLDEFKPDIIGIRTLTYYKEFFHITVAMIRNWGFDVPIIAGGPYATSDYTRILQDGNIDLAVLGEGEITFNEIISEIIANNKKLPGDGMLKKIPGIAFIPAKKNSFNELAREILMVDELTDTLSKEPGRNLEKINQSADVAYAMYTSGSTGNPRGIMVEHRNVIRLVKNANYIELDQETCILQTGAPVFDATTFEIWGSLLNGGKLVIVENYIILDAYKLGKALIENHINTLWLSSPLFNQLMQQDSDIFSFPGLKYLLVGGDVLSPRNINEARSRNKKLKVINGYGPTENTTFSACYLVDKDFQSPIPIGKPISNSTVYILDANGHLQPPGIWGELWVGGDGVSRGYLNNPELTAEKFVEKVIGAGDRCRCINKKFLQGPGAVSSKRGVAPPTHSRSARCRSLGDSSQKFAEKTKFHKVLVKIAPGRRRQKIYKTGDLARWLSDGNIEFLGRIDFQVKIRGYRVELGEIENQLLKHPGIKDAVVLYRADESQDRYLCAYIIPGSKELNALRNFLSHSLPYYMIPSYFVLLEKLPLTPNGKIDRKALSAPQKEGKKGKYEAPTDELEYQLATVWSGVLGLAPETIGIRDNFFELGGHSLKAALLISRIYKAFDVKLPLAEVFKTPTIRGLATCIRRTAPGRRYREITPVPDKDYYALSAAQKRLYVQQQFDHLSTRYNVNTVVVLEGKADKEKLVRIFRKLIHQHESFRTSFIIKDGLPVQKIHQRVDFGTAYFDLMSTGPAGLSLDRRIENFVQPFDLSHAPLVRVGLIKIEAEKHILMVDMHHIISDGISFTIIVKEFMALYAGKEIPQSRLRYRDFSEWQKRLDESGKLNHQEEFWLKELDGEIPVLNLPIDFKRPRVQRFEGESLYFEIESSQTADIKKLAGKHGVTLYMVLLSLYFVFLSRITGQEDIVLGTPVAGRSHPDLERVVGMFVNMLPLRNYPQPEKSFREFLIEVSQRTMAAIENQEYPFIHLVEKRLKNRDPGRHPLFDVIFVFEQVDIQFSELPDISIPGLKLTPYSYRNMVSRFDFGLGVNETAGRFFFRCEYSTTLFKSETIKRFVDFFKKVIAIVLKDPDICLKDITLELRVIKARPGISQKDREGFNF